ncbi:MAG: extracellular solute-binding protein [Lachnospiraceae bacterium]|nr:extracellular solute-binding protein [Lachnospiraceae bacterium]
MKKMKRGLSIMLASFLVLQVCACGGSKEREEEKVFTGENVFMEECKLDLGLDKEYKFTPKVSGEDVFYFTPAIQTDVNDFTVTGAGWITGKTDGTHGDFVQVDTQIKGAGNYYLDGWYDGNDNVYLLQSVKDGDEVYTDLVTCNKDGDEISREKIEGTGTDDFWSLFNTDGLAVIVDGEGFRVFDTQNNPVAEGPYPFDPNYMRSVTPMDGGKLAFIGAEGANDAYAVLDPATWNFSEKKMLQGTYTKEFSGAGNCLYFASTSGIYKRDDATGEEKFLLDFSGSSMTADNVISGYVFDDDRVLIVFADSSERGAGGTPRIFYRVSPETALGKTELVLGSVYLGSCPDLLNRIGEFNRSSDQYRIVIRSYYDETGDFEKASKEFKNDLITGNAPDIIIPSVGEDPIVYMKRGAFEDLTPYMEKAGISKDDYLENVIDAGSVDDKLYLFIPRFYLSGCCLTKKEYLNENSGLSFQNMMDLEKKYGIEGKGIYSWGVVDIVEEYTMSVNDVFYNVDTGKCDFDGDDFQKFLEWTGKYSIDFSTSSNPEKIDYEGLFASNQLIAASSFRPTSYHQMHEYNYRYLQGEGVYVALPSGDGTAVPCISPHFMAGISATSEHKDAAFEFIRYFMEDEYMKIRTIRSEEHYFASKKDIFDLQYEWAKDDPYVYVGDLGCMVQKKQTYYISDTEELVIENPTEEDLKVYREFVLSAKGLPNYDNQVFNMVLEEVYPYYVGKKSADKVAQNVQDRMSNYVGEKQK